MLCWFVSDSATGNCLHSGNLLTTEEIKRPFDVSNSCGDKKVQLSIIRKYFTEAGWKDLQTVVKSVKRMAWICSVFDVELQASNALQISCDSCLSSMHASCVRVRKTPKSKNWFCRTCYEMAVVLFCRNAEKLCILQFRVFFINCLILHFWLCIRVVKVGALSHESNTVSSCSTSLQCNVPLL